ncbi:MAG TPA: hypothetical protein VIQ30_12360 [Pseudonocardia sp.]
MNARADEPAPAVPPSTPGPVRIAGVIVALEGLFGVGFGVYVLVRGAEASLSLRAILGQAATFAVMGAIVVAIGAGLLRGRSWSRTPAIVIQAVLLLSAYTMLGPSRQVLIGTLVAALTISTLMLLLSGPARRWSQSADESWRQH